MTEPEKTRLGKPYLFAVYEVAHSDSPGGVDCWEVTSDDVPNEPDYWAGNFKTALEAIEFVLSQFPGEYIDINVLSLKWYYEKSEWR